MVSPLDVLHIFDSLQERSFWLLAGVSVVTFFGSLAALPFLLLRLPENYFNEQRRKPLSSFGTKPWLRWPLLALKNIIGGVLLITGVLMLFLPGQGVLTILAGLMLLDFPGKFALERRLASHRKVLAAMNAVRRRAGKPPLRPPADRRN